jgi:hypothetical protein
MIKLLVLLVLPALTFGQTKLTQTISLLDNKVEIGAPAALQKMTPAVWKLKYGAAQQPDLALSDKNAEVNLIAQYTTQKWTSDDLTEYKDYRIANLKKTRTDVQVLEDGIKDINGKKVGFFKFTTQAKGDKIFNYYFFTVVDGKILLFTFNCTATLKSSWEKTADEMAASLKVK